MTGGFTSVAVMKLSLYGLDKVYVANSFIRSLLHAWMRYSWGVNGRCKAVGLTDRIRWVGHVSTPTVLRRWYRSQDGVTVVIATLKVSLWLSRPRRTVAGEGFGRFPLVIERGSLRA